jgi:hypothetical protein
MTNRSRLTQYAALRELVGAAEKEKDEENLPQPLRFPLFSSPTRMCSRITCIFSVKVKGGEQRKGAV